MCVVAWVVLRSAEEAVFELWSLVVKEKRLEVDRQEVLRYEEVAPSMTEKVVCSWNGGDAKSSWFLWGYGGRWG